MKGLVTFSLENPEFRKNVNVLSLYLKTSCEKRIRYILCGFRVQERERGEKSPSLKKTK